MKRNTPEEDLILALACGSTVEAAAQKAGVSERTIYRKLGNPLFRDKLQRFRSETFERASSMLTMVSVEAVKTLLNLLERSNSGSIRLGAARSILEQGVRLREMTEIEERMKRLEEMSDSYEDEPRGRRKAD